MTKKEISKERKILYYAGMMIIAIGLILFMSTFFTNPDRFLMGEVSMGSIASKAVIGFIMVAVGGLMMKVAARGTAGSGLLLDPEKARDDLSPWSSMAGGMIDDALSETQIGTGKEVIKIRCQSCASLNDEDAKYCKVCGEKM